MNLTTFNDMAVIRLFLLAICYVFISGMQCLRAQQHAYIPIPENHLLLRSMSKTALNDCGSGAMIVGGDTIVNGKHWVAIRDTNCMGEKSAIHTLWRQDTLARKVWGLHDFNTADPKEYLLMDFGLAEGDTFSTISDQFYNGSFKITLKIKSIDSVLFEDSKFHLRYKLYSTTNSAHIYGEVFDEFGVLQEDTFAYAIEGFGMAGYNDYMNLYTTSNFTKASTPRCVKLNDKLYFSMIAGQAQGYCDFYQEMWDHYVSMDESDLSKVDISYVNNGIDVNVVKNGWYCRVLSIHGQLLKGQNLFLGTNFIDLSSISKSSVLIVAFISPDGEKVFSKIFN